MEALPEVLTSFTPNQRSVLRILAQHHADDPESPGETADSNHHTLCWFVMCVTRNGNADSRSTVEHPGLLYLSYFGECEDQMLVTSHEAFRKLLHEMQEHKYVAVRKGSDPRGDVYYVPFSAKHVSVEVVVCGNCTSRPTLSRHSLCTSTLPSDQVAAEHLRSVELA